MTSNGVRITAHDGAFFVGAKQPGKNAYKPDSMHHDGKKAVARAADLLGVSNWSAEQHGAAMADAVNLQRIRNLEAELATARGRIAELEQRAGWPA